MKIVIDYTRLHYPPSLMIGLGFQWGCGYRKEFRVWPPRWLVNRRNRRLQP